MEKPPKKIRSGSSITFTGRLIEYESRRPLQNATARLIVKDEGRDDLIDSSIADNVGRFFAVWMARRMDFHGNIAEVYAKFEENDDYQPSKSKEYTYTIEIEETE
ncbi:MAG: hypothetical protein RMJ07_00770 [Nitrososphaerota archaeon]|nr:hypothetical protein [Candidatus Bathyarchaeota archaeon]MDW8048205.1 hypothetical protein [Nitrososphaerota archaeon]